MQDPIMCYIKKPINLKTQVKSEKKYAMQRLIK